MEHALAAEDHPLQRDEDQIDKEGRRTEGVSGETGDRVRQRTDRGRPEIRLSNDCNAAGRDKHPCYQQGPSPHIFKELI